MCMNMCRSMIKNRLFVFTWPLVAVAFELILWPYLWGFLFYSNYSWRHTPNILKHLDAYVTILSWKGGILYFCMAFAILMWSYFRWIKNPCKKTLLFTMFTTWILCGYPGRCALFLLAWGFGW